MQFYVFWLIGALLLILDLFGRLIVSERRARLFRWLATAAALGVAAVALLAIVRMDELGGGGIAIAISLAYLVLSSTFAIGLWLDHGSAVVIRRLSYAGLLLVGLLPSWLFLFFNGPLLFAGFGLSRSLAPGTRPPAGSQAST